MYAFTAASVNDNASGLGALCASLENTAVPVQMMQVLPFYVIFEEVGVAQECGAVTFIQRFGSALASESSDRIKV